jgi:arginase family enzyme
MPDHLPWSQATVNLPGERQRTTTSRSNATWLRSIEEELVGVGHSIDGIDPAFAPGLGRPEAGGASSAHALRNPQTQQRRCCGLLTW